MRILKTICLIYVFDFFAGWHSVAAQKWSIDGDTIYVHEQAEQAIKFWSEPSYTDLDVKEYNWSVTRKIISITPTSKHSKQATLTVKESSRLHRFVIIYSDSALEPNVYDISTSKKLEEKYRDFQRRKLAGAQWATKKQAEIKSLETLILEANADYELGRLDSAKQKYQKIIEIDKDNRNAGDKLKEIDIKIEERVTDNYWDLLARSRIELVSKNFEKAVEFCDEAIKIKPDENAAKKLRNEIIKVRDDDTFQMSLRTASKAIIARNYDEAKRAYDEAKKLKPGDPQLLKMNDNLSKLLSKVLQEKKSNEAEEAYNRLITVADEAYKAQNYEVAKVEYLKAGNVLKNKKYPAEQIKLINSKLADLATKEKSEKARLEKEERLNATYVSLITAGNSAMEKKEYTAAFGAFKKASDLKPFEQYPKDKVAEIMIELARKNKEAEAEKENAILKKEKLKNYTLAIARGKALLREDKLQSAKAAYTEALVLYPDAEEPKKQLQKIETQLVEVTKQAEIDERYNKLIRIGDSALKAGDFHLSLKNFQQALDMKPEKAYPLKQIKAAESGIQNRLRTAKEPEANKMRQP